MAFSIGDVFEGECTLKEYVAQYEVSVPVLGETYLVNKGSWMEREVEITCITPDGKIAVGQGRGVKHGRQDDSVWLFYATGVLSGFKYHDTSRPGYRLQKKEK